MKIVYDEYQNIIIPQIKKLWPRFEFNTENIAAIWVAIRPYFKDTIIEALRIHYTDNTRFKPDWGKVVGYCKHIIAECTNKKHESPRDKYVREWSECYRRWNMLASEDYLIGCFRKGTPPALFFDKIQPACRELAAKTKAICKEVNDREQKSKYAKIRELVTNEIESREAYD